jgi:hypothetical protein
MMAGIDGIQVLRKLGYSRSTAKVIIFSGADGRILEAARRFGLESGVQVVAALAKPTRLAELRGVLERAKVASSLSPTCSTADLTGHSQH